MIGIVLVTHGRLADEFRAALEHIIGPQEQIETISIGAEDDLNLCRGDIIEAINRVDTGDGVAILTDMFGGTPCSLAISCMIRPMVDIIPGINLQCWSNWPRCARVVPCRRLSAWPRRPVANTSRSRARACRGSRRAQLRTDHKCPLRAIGLPLAPRLAPDCCSFAVPTESAWGLLSETHSRDFPNGVGEFLRGLAGMPPPSAGFRTGHPFR